MKPFFIKIQTFWAWADKFWGIWGIFGQFISTHFGTLSSLFSINQPLCLQKTKPFISKSQIFIWGWDLNLGRKELGIQSSCVRSPWQHSTAFMLLCCRIIGCKFPDFSLVKLLPITNDYEISSNHLLGLGEPCITYVGSSPNHLDFYNGKNYLGHMYYV